MADEPSRQGDPSPPTNEDPATDAILPFGDRLDEIARARFNRTDWIELAAPRVLMDWCHHMEATVGSNADGCGRSTFAKILPIQA